MRDAFVSYKPKPSNVLFNITFRCNLKCKHCDIWKDKSGKELSTEEIKEIIDKLKNWLEYFRLHFSGGEPLVRKDIFEIIKYCS
jgi:MoaA/NifB/PqqE/SkfB family radical SAM enzyme